ncbi:MAG: RNA-binding cell elongation regulator Jag/EloR [Bacillota bacterium]
MRRIEKRGRTVEEAVQAALKELGIGPDEAEVEVLQEGRRGFLGLGSREAWVRVTRKRRPDRFAVGFVNEILRTMRLRGEVRAEERDGRLWVEVEGEDLGALIGHRGRTLDALEYLVNLAVGRECGGRQRLVLDVAGYRQRRAEAVRRMALQAAEKVRRTGRPATLEPMTARERKLVHLALQGDPQLVTRSEGEEPFRKIVISRK